MAKRETVETFRRRLIEKIESSGLSRARFASRAGLSRSTLSQLLLESNVRLPRAETIAQIAARHRCSADWLLGLSEQDQVAADVVPQMVIEPDAGDPADERLRRWHSEAAGMKIRYVPATLPDHLKTDAMIAFETGRLETAAATAWTDVARTRIEYAQRPESEIEVCSPLQDLVAFARGEGMWAGFPLSQRREQIENMATMLDRLYPSYRWYLFDARERFAAPYSVFGARRAVIYVGDLYLVLTTTELIREFASHFDGLIRAARVQPNETPALVASLVKDIR